MSFSDLYLLALASLFGACAFWTFMRLGRWMFWAALSFISAAMYVAPHLHSISCTVTP